MTALHRVERGVPMPSEKRSHPESYAGTKWGFTDAMAIGDSFVSREPFARLRSALVARAKKTGFKWSIRKRSDGFYRVWRVS